MLRISVVGNSGSGKTTLARELARALGVPHLELDSVFHQPDWQPLDRQEFRRRVSDFTTGDNWVVDGNYSAVRDIVWSRADTVIWLDPSRLRVMRQLAWRTLGRMATRAELWNGNRERWRYLFMREESIILYAWTHHGRYRDRYLAAQADPANAHLAFVRVRTPAENAALLRAVACPRKSLDPDAAGLLHYLRHGYDEGGADASSVHVHRPRLRKGHDASCERSTSGSWRM